MTASLWMNHELFMTWYKFVIELVLNVDNKANNSEKIIQWISHELIGKNSLKRFLNRWIGGDEGYYGR